MKYFYTDFRNNIDFFLRSLITISRKNYCEKPADINKLFDNKEQRCLYNELEKRYDLGSFKKLNEVNFLTNLNFLDIFEKHIMPEEKTLSVLDIGSKNWNYAASEYVFFKSFTNKLRLRGIELDAYRLCTNLYNRYEIAKFYTKDLEDTEYIPDNLMNHTEKYDYIIWILPFITEYPLLRWGLPLKYFKPEEMLEHAYSLLNNNGELLIINQGEDEYQIQTELNKKLNLCYEPIGEVSSVFSPFKNKRFCSKIIKK